MKLQLSLILVISMLVLGPITMLVLSSNITTPIQAKNDQGELKNENKFVWETSSIPKFITTLDPALNYESGGNTLIDLVYECLVDYEGNSAVEMRASLATSWDVSPDGLKYTFILRENVTFHDGVAFNAYVMKYSLDRAVILGDPYGPSWMIAQVIKGGTTYMGYSDPNVTQALTYLNAGGIVAVDDFTLEINLDIAYSPFIHTLAFEVASAVSPKAVIENTPSKYTTDDDDLFGMVPLDEWIPQLSKLGLGNGADPKDSGVVPGTSRHGLTNHSWIAKNMVGTGPYMLDSLTDEYAHLKKNINWWGSFAPHAVDEIEIKTVSDDDARIGDLESGDADMVSIDSHDAYRVMSETGEAILEDVNVFVTPLFQNNFIGMNMRESISTEALSESVDSTYDASSLLRYDNQPEIASPYNPFTALLFRQAITTAFDHAAYNQGIVTEQMEGVIPSGMFGHHESLIEEGYYPTYDLEAATALFNQVGWKGTIKIEYNANSESAASAFQLLANAIVRADVGIEVLLQPVDPECCEESLLKMDQPLYYTGWVADYADPDNFVAPYFHGEYGIFPNMFGFNIGSGLNELIEEASVEQNANTREKLYHSIEEIAARSYYYLYLHQKQKVTVVRDWIQDFEESGSLNPVGGAPNLENCNKIFYYHDRDDDGMPDLWEFQMGLNTTDSSDAKKDSDGDWVINIDEYRGGTNPKDFWSFPLLSFSIFHMGVFLVLCGIALVISAAIIQKERQKRALVTKLKAPDYLTALKIQKLGFTDYIALVQVESQAKNTFEKGFSFFLQGAFSDAIEQYTQALTIFELLEKDGLIAEAIFRIIQAQKEASSLTPDRELLQRFPHPPFEDSYVEALNHMISAMLAETDKNWGSAEKEWRTALTKDLAQEFQVICQGALAESEFKNWLSNPTIEVKEKLLERLDEWQEECEENQYSACLCQVYLLRARIELASFQFESTESWLNRCIEVAEKAGMKLYQDIALEESENLLQLKTKIASLLKLEAPLTPDEQIKRVQNYVRDALGIKAQNHNKNVEKSIELAPSKS
ncbi:MAG: hypothetical protein JSV04_01895 [Candidatus Heimdallarchaeota archaeon]|nr:MAG: hypothetical protein JSV04_01895 [Candidatus Heimdallarchaeota archaeon]